MNPRPTLAFPPPPNFVPVENWRAANLFF